MATPTDRRLDWLPLGLPKYFSSFLTPAHVEGPSFPMNQNPALYIDINTWIGEPSNAILCVISPSERCTKKIVLQAPIRAFNSHSPPPFGRLPPVPTPKENLRSCAEDFFRKTSAQIRQLNSGGGSQEKKFNSQFMSYANLLLWNLYQRWRK